MLSSTTLLFIFFFLSVVAYQFAFNLLNYLGNKKAVFLFYSLYLLIILLNFLQSFSGYPFIAAFKINNYYYNIFMGLPINFLVNMSYMLFFEKYFHLKTTDSRLYRKNILLVLINAVATIFCFLYVIVEKDSLSEITKRVIQFSTFILAMYPLFLLFKSKIKNYGYILLGSSILGISFLISVFIAMLNDINDTHHNTDIFAALGILVELFIFNYALQQKSKQQEKELLIAHYEKNKILDNEHLRLSADLHDEVGSSLSSVYILSLLVQKRMENSDIELKNHQSQITEQVKQIMQSISDIVWGFRRDLNTVDDFLVKANELLHQNFEPNNIRYNITVSENIKNQQLNSMQRSNLNLAFKEAINNIMKYAKATVVNINVDIKNSGFILSIKDNGIGFLHNTQSRKPSNGLLNMERRMHQLGGTFTINTQLNIGTELVFKFPI